VIHLAAKVGGLFANMQQKVEFYRENIMINDNVMECCRVAKVEKVRAGGAGRRSEATTAHLKLAAYFDPSFGLTSLVPPRSSYY